mgnify:CR=1 FL=1|jgi:hypothetical protein
MAGEASLIDELLRYRLEMLSKEIPELKLAFEGNQLILNVCVAYSRQVAAKCVKLEEENAALTERQDVLETEIAELRLQAGVHHDRLENMAQWAKTKGKT